MTVFVYVQLAQRTGLAHIRHAKDAAGLFEVNYGYDAAGGRRYTRDMLATDLDGDSDVDLTDYGLFQACFNGANAPPKCNSAAPVRYTWDGENRLKAAEPMTPVNGVSRKVEFAYDYMNRRVQKKVYNRTSGAWVLATDQRFVYDGWNVVMVVNSSGTPQQKYTWGLDLSGQTGTPYAGGIHGAGGIGGLLAVEETATEGSPCYWFFYDGNGNVGQIINASDQSIAARYEYDPYGNVIGPDEDADGDWQDDATAYALANPYRFSTKPFDAETGLGYWGWRYAWFRIGRWGSFDPAEERGGFNAYLFVANNPIDKADVDGRGLFDFLSYWKNCNTFNDMLKVYWDACQIYARFYGAAGLMCEYPCSGERLHPLVGGNEYQHSFLCCIKTRSADADIYPSGWLQWGIDNCTLAAIETIRTPVQWVPRCCKVAGYVVSQAR